jgi:hypothetical protein
VRVKLRKVFIFFAIDVLLLCTKIKNKNKKQVTEGATEFLTTDFREIPYFRDELTLQVDTRTKSSCEPWRIGHTEFRRIRIRDTAFSSPSRF